MKMSHGYDVEFGIVLVEVEKQPVHVRFVGRQMYYQYDY